MKLYYTGTGCTHNYHPGPPSDFAQATAERLRSLLLDTLRLVPASTLRITHQDPTTTDTTTDTTSPPETKAFWTLYIDIVCISLDGNILDAALAACVAALKTTVLPVAHWDVDNERVVCSRTETRPLALASADGGLAFSASFGVVGWRGPGGGGGEEEEEEDGGDDGGNEVVRKWVLSDLDEFEEEVVPEKVLVCIKNGGCIAKIEKSGGVLAGPEEVLECVRRAKERYRELERLVDSAVRAEAA